MKKIFIFLLVLYTLNIQAQSKRIIRINPNDCSNCYLAFHEFKEWKKVDSTIIVMPNIDSIEALESIANLQIELQGITILRNSIVYDQISKFKSSSIQEYQSDSLQFEFPIKWYDNYKWLLKYGKKTLISGKLPSSFETKIFGNNAFILDRKKDQISLYNLNGPCKLSYKFSLDTNLNKKIMHEKFGSDEMYNSFYNSGFNSKIPPMIKRWKIEGLTFSKDTLHIISSHLYFLPCVFKGKGDSCLYYFYSLISIAKDNKTLIRPITFEGEGTTQLYEGTGVIIGGNSLEYINNEFYVNSIKAEISFDKTDRFVYKLTKHKNGFEFNPPMNILLPSLLLKNPFSFVSDFRIAYPFLLPAFSNQIYNLEKNKYYDLDLNIGNLDYLNTKSNRDNIPVEVKFKLIDLIQETNQIRILMHLNGEYKVITYSKTDLKKLSEVTIIKNENTFFRSEPSFENFDTVLTFPNACVCYERILIK